MLTRRCVSKLGSLPVESGWLTGPGLDAKIVNMEQTKVQSSLDTLQKSDVTAYNNLIQDANKLLNPSDGVKRVAPDTDAAYNNFLDQVRKGLGRDIDFSRQSDRENIGNAVIKHIKQTGGCDITGNKVAGCK